MPKNKKTNNSKKRGTKEIKVLPSLYKWFLIATAFFSIVWIVVSIQQILFLKRSNRESNYDKSEDFPNSRDIQNIDQGKIPDVFPVDFPLYPGLILQNNWVSSTGGTVGISLVFVSSEQPREVFGYFEKNLSERDYKPKVISSGGNTYTVSFGKEDINGFVGITKEDDNTIVSITMGIKNSGD